MKVLDLHCHLGHVFEGWFGSEDDFQSQLARGLVQCPMCDSPQISKKLSAPRLNLSGAGCEKEANAEPTNASKSIAVPAHSTRKNHQNNSQKKPSEDVLQALTEHPEFQKAYLEMSKQILAQTEDVGKQFASEARKIHYGLEPERGIRGQASQDEVMELLDEGIDVMPLVLPSALKGTIQ